MNKTRFLTISAICLFHFFQAESHVEILWDTYGVPHIMASTDREMYYAFGWAQLEMHPDLLLRLYGQARGKAAQYWGPGFVESDRLINLFEIPVHAQENYNALTAQWKNCINAFADGINDYAKKHPETIDTEYRKVLPVKAADVLSHMLRILCLEFIGGNELHKEKVQNSQGSNAIAIGANKSSSGNTMLIINPHLPWNDFYIWFEAHLRSEQFNAYGIALVGMPALSMGFNQTLGWAFTINPVDGADRFRLKLMNDGYLVDDKLLPFSKKRMQFKIAMPNGSFRREQTEFLYSVHGPVISRKENEAIALRITGLNNYGIFEQFHRMAQARDLKEFQTALQMMQLPIFNILYADADKNIFYLYNGNIPERKCGDSNFWSGVVDGSKSEYIWTKIHPYMDLPKLLNPQTGFIQNCNDPPWTCAYPPILKKEAFPPYFATQYYMWRAQRATHMLIDAEKLSYEDLKRIKINTVMETAERFLDDLIKASEIYPDSALSPAISLLKNWDRTTDTDSRGSVLFAQWFSKLNDGMFETRWNPDSNITTPDGFRDPCQAIRFLADAVKELTSMYGTFDITWGEIHRLRMKDFDLPANGGPGEYGIFRTVNFAPDKDGKKFAVGGDTFFAVIEFSKPVHAECVLAYGNSSRNDSRHRGDQLELMVEKKFRPALTEQNDIQMHLEKTEVLSYP